MQLDPFTKFNQDWGLLTAGTPEKFNSMTISWGSMGTVWSRDVITVYGQGGGEKSVYDSDYNTVNSACINMAYVEIVK